MASAVRKVEGLPPRREAQLRRPGGGMDAPHNWIVVTSATVQNILLSSGVTVPGYPAVWSYFDSSQAGWVDTLNAAWYVGANGETPTAGTRYECRLLGQDNAGVAIWSSTTSQETCATLVLGPFVTGAGCDANNGLTFQVQYLCIPNGNICDAYFVDDPSGCGTPSPPPAPPPPPSPPPVFDPFFFGNDWP